MKDVIFKYKFGDDISFELKEKDFVTIVGNNNDLIVHTLLHGNKKAEIIINNSKFEYKTLLKMRRNMSIVVYKHLDIFVGEKVVDEIVYGLESLAMKKNEIRELISSYARMFKLDELLERDPNSLGSSDKVKMKILSSMIIL